MIYTNQTQTVYFSQGSGGGIWDTAILKRNTQEILQIVERYSCLNVGRWGPVEGYTCFQLTYWKESLTSTGSDFVSHTLIQLWDLYRLIIKYWPFLMLGNSSRCLLLPQANLALNGERLKGMNHPRMTSQEPSHLKTLKSGWSSLTSLLINFQGR